MAYRPVGGEISRNLSITLSSLCIATRVSSVLYRNHFERNISRKRLIFINLNNAGI